MCGYTDKMLIGHRTNGFFLNIWTSQVLIFPLFANTTLEINQKQQVCVAARTSNHSMTLTAVELGRGRHISIDMQPVSRLNRKPAARH